MRGIKEEEEEGKGLGKGVGRNHHGDNEICARTGGIGIQADAPYKLHQPTNHSLNVLLLVTLSHINLSPSWLELHLLHLADKLPVGCEGETQGLGVVLQDVLDAIVELCVHHFHVTQCYPLPRQHLVEWTHEEC